MKVFFCAWGGLSWKPTVFQRPLVNGLPSSTETSRFPTLPQPAPKLKKNNHSWWSFFVLGGGFGVSSQIRYAHKWLLPGLVSFVSNSSLKMTPSFEPARKPSSWLSPQAQKSYAYFVLGGGFEPPTLRSSGECSTN